MPAAPSVRPTSSPTADAGGSDNAEPFADALNGALSGHRDADDRVERPGRRNAYGHDRGHAPTSDRKIAAKPGPTTGPKGDGTADATVDPSEAAPEDGATAATATSGGPAGVAAALWALVVGAASGSPKAAVASPAAASGDAAAAVGAAGPAGAALSAATTGPTVAALLAQSGTGTTPTADGTAGLPVAAPAATAGTPALAAPPAPPAPAATPAADAAAAIAAAGATVTSSQRSVEATNAAPSAAAAGAPAAPAVVPQTPAAATPSPVPVPATPEPAAAAVLTSAATAVAPATPVPPPTPASSTEGSPDGAVDGAPPSAPGGAVPAVPAAGGGLSSGAGGAGQDAGSSGSSPSDGVPDVTSVGPAAVPAPSATAPTEVDAAPAPAPPVPVSGQVARHVAALRGAPDGTQSMTLVLTPERLGPVEVQVTISQGSLDLNLRGAHEHGRAALLEALPDLRRDLQAAGLTLSRLEVDRDTGGAFTAPQQNPGERRGQQEGAGGHLRPWSRTADSGESRPVPRPSHRSERGLDVRV
jgi:flagellar hook-length control protein FliK